MKFKTIVTKAPGFDLATRPESKKGQIKAPELASIIGKRIVVTIDADEGTEVTQTIKEIDNTIMPVVV